jgi:hypothetical protein
MDDFFTSWQIQLMDEKINVTSLNKELIYVDGVATYVASDVSNEKFGCC